MTSHRFLLSVVPILLTSPAWTSLCANQDSCAGQGQTAMDQAPGEVGRCHASSCTSSVGLGRCQDACIGSCESVCAQPPQIDSQTLSLLYVLIQTQVCHPVSAVHTSCGFMHMTCPMSIIAGQMQLP